MKKILIIEDDINVREPLAQYLVKEGFTVLTASSLKEAEEKIKLNPHALVLDWNLPDGLGIDWLKRLRENGFATPVLMLTARAELTDKVLGLEIGANDYMTKPFEPRELTARLRAQMRSMAGPTSQGLEVAGIVMNTSTREVSWRGKSVELAKMEFELLKVFLENPNRVFSRDELLNQVWGYDNYPSSRTVDTHVAILRQKFKPEMFETLRGVGYRFRKAD